MALTDNSFMPYGKHKGKKMINVPADYLLWLYENQKCSGEVRAYIASNHEVLTVQAKRIREEQSKRFMY
jgi:uncharacterized protein (DUF3820 family)